MNAYSMTRALILGFGLVLSLITLSSAQPLFDYKPTPFSDLKNSTLAERTKSHLNTALARVTKDQELRRKFIQALESGDEANFQRISDKIGIPTLGAYLRSIEGNLKGLRQQITAAQKRNNEAEVNRLSRILESQKLNTHELASIVYIYTWRDKHQVDSSKDNRLILSDGASHAFTRNAHRAGSISKWQYVPWRLHGKKKRLEPYDGNLWIDLVQAFRDLSLEAEFLEIFSQLVHYEGRHLTYRHIEHLPNIFLLSLHRWVRSGKTSGEKREARLYFAKKLFLSYVAGMGPLRAAARASRRYGEDPDQWPARERNSLAAFIKRFDLINEPETLERFFERGEWPASLPKPNSEILRHAADFFSPRSAGIRQNLASLLDACRRHYRPF